MVNKLIATVTHCEGDHPKGPLTSFVETVKNEVGKLSESEDTHPHTRNSLEAILRSSEIQGESAMRFEMRDSSL